MLGGALLSRSSYCVCELEWYIGWLVVHAIDVIQGNMPSGLVSILAFMLTWRV